MKQLIKNGDRFLGTVGEYTGHEDLYVGDIVEVDINKDDQIYKCIIVFDQYQNRYSALGFLTYSLIELTTKYKVKKVFGFTEINNNNISSLSEFSDMRLVERNNVIYKNLKFKNLKCSVGCKKSFHHDINTGNLYCELCDKDVTYEVDNNE